MEIRRGSSGKDGAGSVGIGLPVRPLHDLDLGLQNNSVWNILQRPIGIRIKGGCVGIRHANAEHTEPCMRGDVEEGKAALITDHLLFF